MTTQPPDPSQPGSRGPAQAGPQSPGGARPGGAPLGGPPAGGPGAPGGQVPAPTQSAFEPWGRRVGATFIDGIIIGVIYFVLTLILGAIVGVAASGVGTIDAGGGIAIFLLIALVPLLVATLGYAVPLYSRKGPQNGQTLGKQVLNVRVVRGDGQPMTAGPTIIRELAKTVAPTILMLTGIGAIIALPYYLVDNLFPLWDARQQSLHDKIASTFVRPE